MEKDYSQRDVLDKLGIKPGQAIAFSPRPDAVGSDLRRRVVDRAGRSLAGDGEPVDVVLAVVDDCADAAALLSRWRSRLKPAGGIWLLSPKRGQPGYVDQRVLIAAGLAAGLVDNKSCSVSDTTSGVRFVIRKSDRSRLHSIGEQPSPTQIIRDTIPMQYAAGPGRRSAIVGKGAWMAQQQQPDSAEVIARLRELMPLLRSEHGVRALGLFGSYVTGRAHSSSDIDLLVEFEQVPSLFRLIELELYLSDLLGKKVDLVISRTLKPAMKERILSEVQAI